MRTKPVVRRQRVGRAASIMLLLAVVCVACEPLEDGGFPVTAPPETRDGTIVVSTTSRPVGIDTDWFGRPASEAIPALESQGFVVIDILVCSSSVGAGEIRQITDGTGTVLVDKEGVTEEGRLLEEGLALQVKIGDGSPCE